jgi:hypothetical protein
MESKPAVESELVSAQAWERGKWAAELLRVQFLEYLHIETRGSIYKDSYSSLG